MTKIIVVADDCPDGSAIQVVSDFPEVIYLKNPKPSGGWPGRVRNCALSYVYQNRIRADYVHFLDDDDTVPKGHYARLKETFETLPTTGVVFGILRPFCDFASDLAQRERQELQLRNVQDWRIETGRFPWFYHQLGSTLVAVWNPLGLSKAAKIAHTNEWMQELKSRQRLLRAEMGLFNYYIQKTAFRVTKSVFGACVFPILDRQGYFNRLYQITTPDMSTTKHETMASTKVSD